MIEVKGLTKRYGQVVAVDDLTFNVEAGRVTGFLGPNGAGKSTTMRMLLGLDRPTSGTARVAGKEVVTFAEPLRSIGALLDAGAVHPGRTGRNHLRVAAKTHGIALSRVDEVLDIVGLESAAKRRIKGYSLGMRQRLGIAAALLGDPAVVVFDEPVNGLDLDGVRWIRDLLRGLADEGRTVLVSSHLMSEMQQTADHLIVIGRGRLIADASMDDILQGLGRKQTSVRSANVEALVAVLTERGLGAQRISDRELLVDDISSEDLGELAHARGIALHHLADIRPSLERAYMELTESSMEYRGGENAATELAATSGAQR